MTFGLMCLSLALGAEPATYTKPDLLIEPAALKERLDKFVIIDVQPAKAYDDGHIPGATRVDAAEWSKAFTEPRDNKTWGKILAELGIAADKPVVVYGDSWT